MTLIAVKMTKCLALETVESWISVTSFYFYFLWNVDSKPALMGKWQKYWERGGGFSAALGNSQSVRLALLAVIFPQLSSFPLLPFCSFFLVSPTTLYPHLSFSGATLFLVSSQGTITTISPLSKAPFVLLKWDQLKEGESLFTVRAKR